MYSATIFFVILQQPTPRSCQTDHTARGAPIFVGFFKLEDRNPNTTMPIALSQWLDEQCPEWQHAPLTLVNAHLRLLGPKAITLINGQVVVGTLQMAGVDAQHMFGRPGQRVSVAHHFEMRLGVILGRPGDQLVYLVRNPGSLLPVETLTIE
ncbi:unnamed protein product [Caenorhabditis nigoni]